DSNIRALQRIRVSIVHALPVGVELFAEEVIVEASVGARQSRVTVGRSKISPIGAKAEFGDWNASSTRPHLYDAGHGIGAVQSALSASHKFQAIRLRQGQSAEVKRLARYVDRNPIDNHFVVSGFAAANKER